MWESEVPPNPPSRFVQAGARFMAKGPMQSFLRRYGWRLDRALIKLSNGHVSMSMVIPEVLLTHTGAKSGQKRSTPLTYFTDGGRVIVIASNYGDARHPGWYHNVKANPRVTLSSRGYQGTFVGEEMLGDERDRLFELATQYMPNYAGYQKTTKGRRIPVVAFTEVD
ncbi:MAG: nitroreductase family deazaflavin-dependent oxidoreductase [Mycobacterium sp.]